MLLGQDQLKNKLSNITLSTMPHSVLIVGDLGCGKHTLFKMLVDKLNLPFLDITENITSEQIADIQLSNTPAIYLIDDTNPKHVLTSKEQNSLLKLVEEPTASTFIVIITENKLSILPTLANRCQCWEFQKYSKNMLVSLNPKLAQYSEFLNTPGQMLNIKEDLILDTLTLADKMIDSMKIASLPNTLMIADKLIFTSSFTELNGELLLKCLLFLINKRLIKQHDNKLYELFDLTAVTESKYNFNHVDRKLLIENYLTQCWRLWRNF